MTYAITAKLRITSLVSALVALTALGLGSAVPAVAQTQGVQVTVPFAFQASKQQMPAGTYRIEINSNHLLTLRNEDSGASSVLIANSDQRSMDSTAGKVIFHKYGSQYFLAEVWQPGQASGRKLLKSRREKEARLALNAPSASSSELALNTLPR